MGFIRLRAGYLLPFAPVIRFIDEQGQERVVPLLQLHAGIRIGKQRVPSAGKPRRILNAILDTGAPLTIFPKPYWQEFASQIVRLPLVGNQPTIGRVGGRTFTYFLGRVWVSAFDTFGRELPPVPVVAQFREDDIPPGQQVPQILLGLWGGILEGRHLTRWPTTERYDPDIPTLESHGQWWNLSEP